MSKISHEEREGIQKRVLKYMLNTSSFLIGTYRYRVTITLQDGSTRTSNWFNFTVN